MGLYIGRRLAHLLGAMNWLSRAFAPVGLVAALSLAPSVAASDAAPSFKEVLELLRTNLVNIDESRLDRAAAEGLLQQFAPLACLVTNAPVEPAANGPSLAKSSVLEGTCGYVRVATVNSNLAPELQAALKSLAQTNKLKGWLVDLRFCGGADYQAAAAAGELFTGPDQALIDYGQGMIRSKGGQPSSRLPVMVLVNRQTSQAAEALAAILRATDSALVLGSPTAGQAFVTREFPLQTGGRLRIATAIVKTGDGQALSKDGVKPDILVAVNPEDERAYLDDPYRVLGRTASRASSGDTNPPASLTNRALRPRINEADLVRMLREGTDFDPDGPLLRSREPVRPVLRDPPLARAVDLLKGLAVVKRPVR